jgi:PAN domain
MRLRFLTRVAAELAVLLLVLVLTSPAQAQTGFDRPGGDYTNFVIRSGDPALCAARCEREARCLAWAFSFPRSETAHSACWLKSKVMPRTEDKCCVSGVRGAGVIEPRIGPIEFSIDRTGGDYRNFETPSDSSGAACKAACDADGKCRAWTYVRPGYVGASAHCYLKDKLKPPRAKPCCISGVVR